jgi:DNA polymerase-3 subunit alpha
MMKPSFIHLHAHTAYSLSEGAIKVKELIKLCQKHGMPAVAITDTNNMFGALEFATAAREAGVQPIIGCQLAVVEHLYSPKEEPAQLVFLAQNDQGYRNLLKLVSKAHLESTATEQPHLKLDALTGLSDGIICLTGGPKGPLGKHIAAHQKPLAIELLQKLKALFPDRLYIELMRHGMEDEIRQEEGLIDLAYEFDVPLVATNNCFFADESLYEAHDALLCIAGGNYLIEEKRPRVTRLHGFRSAEEMRETFADLPEAIDNTVVIARRCSFLLKSIPPLLPHFSEASEEELLRASAREGLEERLAQFVFTPEMESAARQAIAKPYRERLDYELGVITKMKFSGYFLIVADFIKWARGQGIPVGPGRGSGAGSVVAWSLTITDLDPLRFGLLFERFLNPDRISMPDFDIDFCQDRRDEVIRYVQDRYGADHVAQIITFGKLQARAVLRDVGRVMQMPYGQVDRICKLVPNNPAKPVTLEEAIAGEPLLQDMRRTDNQVAQLMDMALKLEGLYRHASTHAAGVVIGDRPLEQLIPLYRDPRSDMLVTQFNMKYVEQAGLVKFDFLGLKTLTVLQKAEALIRATGVSLDLARIPLDDEKTFALLSRAEGMGVFQLESSGMRDALRRLKPNRIEDIIALVALYRPGPMDNIPRYGNVKAGIEAPDYLHPSLEPILKETFGIIVYQEQVMQIAQTLAGYSLGSADLLRRAMGKKIKAEMEAQRKTFADGAAAKGIDKAQAAAIFDLVAKFADYGFNKSHAAAYALIAYQTAWLKANYPVEFMAASMTLDMGNTDKLASFRQELTRMGIKLLPPDINRSGVEFAVENGAIRYALAAVKGVGLQAMEALVEERHRGGAFADLFEFAARLDGRTLNKRQLDSLAHAGAFDSLNGNRAQVAAATDMILKQATAAADERSTGQVNLFGGESAAVPKLKLPLVAAYDQFERLKREFDAIGFYLSAHPLDAHAVPLKRIGVINAGELAASLRGAPSTRFKLAGVVIARQERTSARGNKFAFVQLSDVSGVYEVMVFSELLAAHRPLLEAGSTLLLSVDVQMNGDDMRLTAQSIQPLEKAIAHVVSAVTVVCDEAIDPTLLKPLFTENPAGKAKVAFQIKLEGAREVTVELPPAWTLTAKAQTELTRLRGVIAVETA